MEHPIHLEVNQHLIEIYNRETKNLPGWDLIMDVVQLAEMSPSFENKRYATLLYYLLEDLLHTVKRSWVEYTALNDADETVTIIKHEIFENKVGTISSIPITFVSKLGEYQQFYGKKTLAQLNESPQVIETSKLETMVFDNNPDISVSSTEFIEYWANTKIIKERYKEVFQPVINPGTPRIKFERFIERLNIRKEITQVDRHSTSVIAHGKSISMRGFNELYDQFFEAYYALLGKLTNKPFDSKAVNVIWEKDWGKLQGDELMDILFNNLANQVGLTAFLKEVYYHKIVYLIILFKGVSDLRLHNLANDYGKATNDDDFLLINNGYLSLLRLLSSKIREEAKKNGLVTLRPATELTLSDYNISGQLIALFDNPTQDGIPAIKKSILSGISDQAYRQIIDEIYHFGKNLEKLHGLHALFNEERFRDYFLPHLNRISEMHTATGETFNKIGKTDILIQNQNGENVFIAECKLWKGESEIINALNQLFERYVTWRDGKLALIIFNKHVSSFTEILKKGTSAVRAHPLFLDQVSESYDSCTSFLFQHPEDASKQVRMELIMFNCNGK